MTMKAEVNCITKETVYIPYTDEEEEQRVADVALAEEKQGMKAAELAASQQREQDLEAMLAEWRASKGISQPVAEA